MVQIDADPEEIGSNCDVEVGIVGDAKLALQALLETLKGRVERQQAAAESPPGPGDCDDDRGVAGRIRSPNGVERNSD